MSAFAYALMFAIPSFVGLMILEFAYSRWRGLDNWHNQADAISSISSGLSYLTLNALGFGVLVVSYQTVFEWVKPQATSVEGPLLYLLVFVWKDFVGYWMHRWAHANSFLWAMHLIHHSSEEFNLPVALRQNAFSWLSYTGLMLLPLAFLGVPTEVVAVVLPIQFFMQFWYHTQLIGKLGWLEYIIVTPSQHRVHHAQNPIYIDKNFGQIFCWDRLFGSFQEESKKEPPAYGITTAVRHWNPLQIELRYMGQLLRDALFTKKFRNRLGVFLSRTGWRPADVSQRWPSVKMDYRDPKQKFSTENPAWQITWNWLQLALSIAFTAYVIANLGMFDTGTKIWMLLFSLASVYANTQQLMQQASLSAEVFRLTLIGWLGLKHLTAFGFWLSPLLLFSVVTAMSLISMLISLSIWQKERKSGAE